MSSTYESNYYGVVHMSQIDMSSMSSTYESNYYG